MPTETLKHDAMGGLDTLAVLGADPLGRRRERHGSRALARALRQNRKLSCLTSERAAQREEVPEGAEWSRPLSHGGGDLAKGP